LTGQWEVTASAGFRQYPPRARMARGWWPPGGALQGNGSVGGGGSPRCRRRRVAFSCALGIYLGMGGHSPLPWENHTRGCHGPGVCRAWDWSQPRPGDRRPPPPARALGWGREVVGRGRQVALDLTVVCSPRLPPPVWPAVRRPPSPPAQPSGEGRVGAGLGRHWDWGGGVLGCRDRGPAGHPQIGQVRVRVPVTDGDHTEDYPDYVCHRMQVHHPWEAVEGSLGGVIHG